MIRYTNLDANAQNMINCGHSVQEKPLDNVWQYDRHFHESCEILLLIKGDVHYSVDGNSYALKPYDIVLIPPSTYHFAIPMSNEDYENYVINIKPPFVGNKRLQSLFSPPYIINISGDSMLRRMFSLLDFYFENFSEADFKEASEHLIGEILICLSYKQKEEADINLASGANLLISRITAYISDNLDKELNADVIAKHMNFSRSYVQNLFSEVMGIGLKQYVNQKKIYAAHADIQNGLSPNEAARKYCFEDYSSFFRQYKKILGVSPKDGRGQGSGL
ncbi:MAG: helix-turn-helix transcriptional regulator [Clostridia bacterium]|nr:helix-turn-helix transcriptional regulator [Clostridia bacterium]